MFLSGPGTSAAAPWIFLLLVRDPGASLAAPAAGHFASRYSDHTGKDPVLFRMSAVAGFLGWVGLALLISWTPFIISIALLAVSGATAAQIVAAIHDELSDKRDDANERVVAISRMPRAGRWIVGPVSGAWVAAAYGVCPMLWMAALCVLLQVARLGTLNPTVKLKPEAAGERARRSSQRGMRPLLIFTGLYCRFGLALMASTESFKVNGYRSVASRASRFPLWWFYDGASSVPETDRRSTRRWDRTGLRARTDRQRDGGDADRGIACAEQRKR